MNINKGKGMTSHDVVDRVRRITGVRRVGHTGTLDPDATGVLPVCLGKATKIVQFLISSDKEYFATMELGVTTDTQDASGKVTGRKDFTSVTEEDVRRVAGEFIGELEQVPPMVSAVRIGGKRLYELARKGYEVPRPPRRVRILELDILEVDLPRAKFRVVCSKGTYIRTLTMDMGERIGCGAHQAELMRTRSGFFRLEDAVSLEDLANTADLASCLVPVDAALGFLPAIRVRPWFEKFVKSKAIIPPGELRERAPDVVMGGHVRVQGRQGMLLAVAEAVNDPSGGAARLFRTVRTLAAPSAGPLEGTPGE